MKTTFLVARNANRIPTFAGAVLVVLFCAGCSQAVSPTSPSATGAGNSSVGAIQAAKAVPFKGSLEGNVTVTPLQPPFASVHISAAGNATQLGRFTLEVPHIVNFATASGQGTFTFTAANGDTLTADFTGQAQTSTPIHSSVEDATITGGTVGSLGPREVSSSTARLIPWAVRRQVRSRGRFIARQRHQLITGPPPGHRSQWQPRAAGMWAKSHDVYESIRFESICVSIQSGVHVTGRHASRDRAYGCSPSDAGHSRVQPRNGAGRGG